jgi:hypothetical protein
MLGEPLIVRTPIKGRVLNTRGSNPGGEPAAGASLGEGRLNRRHGAGTAEATNAQRILTLFQWDIFGW